MQEGLQQLLQAGARKARSILADAERLLWPGRCAVCRSALLPDERPICGTCWDELSKAVSQHYCRRCGRSVSPYGLLPEGCGRCQDERFRFDGIARAGVYEGAFRQLILDLKFRDATELVLMLGRMLHDVFGASGLNEQADVIVPVPLHWRRRLERGFNQSLLLARALRTYGIPISGDLVRVRYTSRQWNLSHAQRRRNVKNAFRVRRRHRFEGKRICLVDDITTSGATLDECAKTLKEAGATRVVALVLSVAESEG